MIARAMSSHVTSHVCLVSAIVLKHDIDATDNWTVTMIQMNRDVVSDDQDLDNMRENSRFCPIENGGQMVIAWPDFEGRCGEMRTSPEIVLHRPRVSLHLP